MATQQELDFTAPRYPDRAGFKDRDTGMAAAHAIEGSGRAKLLRERFFDLYAQGHRLTADEACARLDVDRLSGRPRVTELVKQGKLLDTGVRRPNVGGRPAKVYRLNPLEKP